MKDSCFIRTRSGLSSQERGANSPLKLRWSIALQSQWHRTGRLKPLFPLQLFCCSVVVGRLVEPEGLDNLGHLISETMPSLTLCPLSPSPSSPLKLPAFLYAHSGLVDRPGCCGVALVQLCCALGRIALGYPPKKKKKNYGLEHGASKSICRLMVK